MVTRKTIADLISRISPLDDLEQQHKAETLDWINSNNEIFRISKPNIPDKHLVSYFCFLDQDQLIIKTLSFGFYQVGM